MKLDLSKDKEKIRKYIARRIKNYAVDVNDGPGEAFFMIEEFDGRYFWPEPKSVRTKGRTLD